MEPASFAEIEVVGRVWLNLARRPVRYHELFANDETDVTRLVERPRSQQPVLVVLEATGGPEGPLTAALVTAGLAVAVLTPRQVRDVAKAIGQLAKTDALDAHLLAQLAIVIRP